MILTADIQGFLEALKQIKDGRFNLAPVNGYSCLEDFLVTHGTAFSCLEPQNIKRGPGRLCFRNAVELAWEDPSMIYCEGFAGVVPVEHAWCIDREGNVHDPTWNFPAEYFGVAIRPDFLNRTLQRRRVYGLLDDLDHGPIMRPPEEWKLIL